MAEISRQLGLTIKVIGSTDLTHYGSNYGFGPQGSGKQAVDWVRNENDRRVIDAMLGLEPEKVIAEARVSQNACCAGAAATAIEAAKHLGADRADELAYATSYRRGTVLWDMWGLFCECGVRISECGIQDRSQESEDR